METELSSQLLERLELDLDLDLEADELIDALTQILQEQKERNEK